MTAIAGLRGTGDWATDERPKNFREFILRRNPNGTAPMFALMARVGKEAVNDPEFSWWDEPNDLVRLTVAGALGSGDTLITVDSSDPSESAPANFWGLAKHLVPGDMLLVEPAVDAATFDHEILVVTSVVSDTQFLVDRGQAGTSAAAIGDDLELLKIGSVFAEGTGAAQATTRNPIKYHNFTQIFKTTYEITATAEVTKTRTGDPVKNDKLRRTWDHSRDIETAFLFGERNEGTGANGKPIRSTRGLRRWIPGGTTTILATDWSIANSAAGGNNLLDAIAPVFDFDTRAGDERIAFCGNGALNRINSAIHKASGVGATTINWNGGATMWGMHFKRLEMPQGTIFIKTHPLMNRHGLYKNSMFIIDFSAIRYRHLTGRDTKAMDNIQNDDEDLRRGQWITEAGLEVSYGGLTCGYIGGFGNTIA